MSECADLEARIVELEQEIQQLKRELNEATKSTGGWRDYVLRQKEELEQENARLQGKWDDAADRCPQCGTGVKASPYVRELEQENERLKKALETGPFLMR